MNASQKQVLKPIRNKMAKLVIEKKYDELVRFLGDLGKKSARLQHMAILVSEEFCISNKIYSYGESIDIIMRDASERIERFDKKAYPLQQREVESVARAFVGWSV